MIRGVDVVGRALAGGRTLLAVVDGDDGRILRLLDSGLHDGWKKAVGPSFISVYSSSPERASLGI